MLSLALVTHTGNYSLINHLKAIIEELSIVKSPITSRDTNEVLNEIIRFRVIKNKDLIVVHPHYPKDDIENITSKNIVLFSGEYNFAELTSSNILKLPRETAFVVIQELVRVLFEAKELNADIHAAFLKEAARIVQNSMEKFEKRKTVEDAIHKKDFQIKPEEIVLSSESDRDCPHSEANMSGSKVLASLMNLNEYFSRSDYYKIDNKLNDAEKSKKINKLSCPIVSGIVTKMGKALWPKARVLYVDDQHERGWSTLLALLIHGSSTNLSKKEYVHELLGERYVKGPVFFAAAKWAEEEELGKNLRLNDSVQNIFGSNFPFDIIFLDYRLLDLEESSEYPEEMSGARLASEIRKLDPAVPIIGISASVKLTGKEGMQPLHFFYPKRSSKEAYLKLTKREFLDLETAIIVAKNKRYLRAIQYIAHQANIKDDHKKYTSKLSDIEIIGNYSKSLQKIIKNSVLSLIKENCLDKNISDSQISVNSTLEMENLLERTLKEVMDFLTQFAEERRLFDLDSKYSYFSNNRDFEIAWHVTRLRNDFMHNKAIRNLMHDNRKQWIMLLVLEVIFVLKKGVLFRGSTLEEYLLIDVCSLDSFGLSIKNIFGRNRDRFLRMFRQHLSKNTKASASQGRTYLELFMDKSKKIKKCLDLWGTPYSSIEENPSVNLVNELCLGDSNSSGSSVLLFCASVRISDIKDELLANVCMQAEQYAFSVYLSRTAGQFENPEIIRSIAKLLKSIACKAIIKLEQNLG